MRLVFLNTWEGELGQKFINFIGKQSKFTDIFCLQEANGIDENLKPYLSNFCHFSDYKFIDDGDIFPQSTYIKNEIQVISQQTLLTKENDVGLCLYTQIQDKNKIINLCNVHGIAQPGDKLDTPGRIKQSQVIIDFLKSFKSQKIIGGDFNLEFDTKSVKLFEDNGYRNLIKEYKIPTTRNHFAWDRFPNSKQLFADFLFVSPDVKVINFSIPSDIVSDHQPMILEIE